MTITTSNRGAIATTLAAVTSAASAVTSVFDTVGTGANMMNSYVTEASKDQADKAKIHRQVFRSNLVTNAALEQNKLQIEVNAHLESNPAEAASFQQVHANLSALFAD